MIRVLWDNQENKVIRYDFEGTVDWTQNEKAQAQEMALLETAKVDKRDTSLILNIGTSIDTGDVALTQLRDRLNKADRQCVVVVTQSRWVNLMVTIVQEVYHKPRLHAVDSLDKAKEIVCREDEKISYNS